MRRIRSMQYALCQIINRSSRYSRECMSPHLKALHWLPSMQNHISIVKTNARGIRKVLCCYNRLRINIGDYGEKLT